MDLDVDRFARRVNGWVAWLTRHWLALANAGVALILGLALLAPWLMLQGQTGPGKLLYFVYQPLCHQLPERSFFLGGPRLVYAYGQLAASLGSEVPARYIGNGQLGFKVAFCERDVAIFAGYLLTGLIFALFRRRMKPLPWQVVALATVPMAVDGLIQLFGIAESNWQRRVITGLLFGMAITWFAYPWVERGMAEAHQIALRGTEEPDAGDR